MSTRRERAKLFKKFSENSKSIFDGYWKELSPTDSLRTENNFNVCPKGAMGGLAETLIEVFFGFKYHSWQKEFGDNLNVTNKANMIYGARLEYQLTDRSHVLCILRPSKTDKIRPYEDGILIEIVKDPATLKSRSKCHWSYLVAYMRATDVDGNPRTMDHLKTYWLRNTKPCFYDGKVASRKVIDKLNAMFGWALSVGLSGSLIFLITTFLNNNSQSEMVGKLEQVSSGLSVVSENQKLLIEEMEVLSVLAEKQTQLIGNQEDANVYLAGIYRLSGEDLKSSVTPSLLSKNIQQLEAKLVELNSDTSTSLKEIISIIRVEDELKK